MSKNKMMFSMIVFVVVFSLMYGYQNMLVTPNPSVLDQVLINAFSFELCFTVAILIALFVYVLLYRKEDDLDSYRFEFIRNQLSDEEAARIDGLSEEERRVAYEIHFNDFTYQQLLECRNYVNQKKAKTNKFAKLGFLSAIVLALTIVLNPTYSDYVLAKEQYNEVLRQQEEAYNQIVEEEYLYYEGLPTIHIISGNSLKVGDVQKYVDQYIRTQPQFLLNNCQIIHICDPTNFESVVTSNGMTYLDELGTVYAYASYYDDSITLQVDPNIYKDQKSAVTHELTHLFDYASGNGYVVHGISDSSEWQYLYQNYASCLGEYGASGSDEFFAEAGAMYVNNPKELMWINMDIYNFMNRIYQMYQKEGIENEKSIRFDVCVTLFYRMCQ